MLILNEVFRKGLNKKEDFILKSLDNYNDSFMAFQILFDVEEDMVFNLGKSFEFTVDKLTNYFLEINVKAKVYFVEEVMTEKGKMADILDSKKIKTLKKGETLNLFVYIDKFSKEELEISIYKREISKTRVLFDKSLINVINRGNLGVSEVKDIELWQHPTTLARYYGLEVYSKEHFKVLENYIKLLANLGTRNVSLILSDAPWDGQMIFSENENISNLYENNIVKITLNPLKLDFSALDKYIDLCHKYGIDKDIDIFGLLGVWKHEKILLNADSRSLKDEEIKTYIDMVYKHFIYKAYIDKTYICVDEPKDVEVLKEGIRYIRENYPRFKIKCAFDKEDVAKEIMPLVDRSSISFFLAMKGMRADSWYICCGPETPNSFVSSNLIEIRSLAYLSKKFGIKNILRWSFMAFTQEPNLDARFLKFRAGDTYIVYPDAAGGANLSLRYMQFLRLLEEISLLKEDSSIYEKVFNINNMEDVLLPKYQVKENFIKRDYEFYVELRRELSTNRNRY